MECRLKDLAQKITKGTTPSNIGEGFSDSGVMYFRSELIGKTKYIDRSAGLLYISEAVHDRLKRSQIEKNDILFSMAGIYLGKVSLVGEDDYPANTNQAVAIIRLKENACSHDYLYYYMTQKWFNVYVNLRTAQAAQPNINLEQIGKLKINLPNRKVQDEIASILSAYDDLIENNNKRIKILEKMSENLYKEWFVRFRFPGHEQAEFENGIPKGWASCKLREIIRIRYGKDHKDLEDGTIPVFGSGGVMRYGNRALYSGETVMIPRKGSLHNVTYYKGDLWTVDTMFYTEFKVPTCASYLYFTLSQFDLESLNKGASIPSLSTDILYNLKIVLPPQGLRNQFQQMIDVLNAQTEKLTLQNQNLTRQRDKLLPRLMSGKLEV